MTETRRRYAEGSNRFGTSRPSAATGMPLRHAGRPVRTGRIGVSRGPGRLQRAVLKRLRETPEGRLSRLELTEHFVKQGGHSSSNLLRAIRGLERDHHVYLRDCSDLAKAYVSLPRPAKFLSEAVISEIVREIGERS